MKRFDKSINPWPIAIIGFFAIFISAAIAFVVFSLNHRMELVRPDYYEHEVRYQEQIQRMNNARVLGPAASVRYEAEEGRLIISLPASSDSDAGTGTIHFYRPSDARLDIEQSLTLDGSGVQRVNVGALRSGLWKVRVGWSARGEEYHLDHAFVVPRQAI